MKRSLLPESAIPQRWYNVQADLPEPCPPPLHPGTREPMPPAMMERIFAKALMQQEMSTERWIEIPDDIRKMLAIWRPTPLVRATGLEQALKTPARIYYKDESGSPPGSHKANTAVAQAYYNQQQGIRRLSTETGAGQWGSSLGFACSLLGLECKVFMVAVSYHQKPDRRSLMHMWDAEVVPSPSEETKAGRSILAEDPDSPGSLGIAISEAVELALERDDTNYTLGSVLNHVMLHQSVIGLETEQQLADFGERGPDVLIGCCGGGSNFGGLVFPFVPRKMKGEAIQLIGIEPQACPTLTRGVYKYDFGDTTELTPLMKMHTLGHRFVPPGIHAGGLRYHGMGPLVSLAVDHGLIEAEAYGQRSVFEAAKLFTATEARLPAPETAHAVKGAIEAALRCKESGEERCIVFNFSGHGLCDLSSYDKFLSGQLTEQEPVLTGARV